MAEFLRNRPMRRRVALAIRAVVIVVLLALLVFVLR